MSEESRFSPGDVVRLKSGGPLMTVHGARSGHDDILTCLWQLQDGLVVDHPFPSHVIRRATRDEVERLTTGAVRQVSSAARTSGPSE